MKLLFCVLTLVGIALTATCPKYTCEKTKEIQLDNKNEAEKGGIGTMESWNFFQEMNETKTCY